MAVQFPSFPRRETVRSADFDSFCPSRGATASRRRVEDRPADVTSTVLVAVAAVSSVVRCSFFILLPPPLIHLLARRPSSRLLPAHAARRLSSLMPRESPAASADHPSVGLRPSYH